VGNEVAAKFGLRFTLPEYLRQVYRTFPLDLERFKRGRIVDAADSSPLPHRSAGHHSGGRERPRLTPPDLSPRTRSRRCGRAPGRAEVHHSTGGRSMADDFEYISPRPARIPRRLSPGLPGRGPEPVVYGVQGALREYYGAKEGPPIASTLDHIVAAVAG